MTKELHPRLTVRLFTDQKCFGPGVSELLHHVQELHSLRAAAGAMEMAYSKAWKMIKNAENCLGLRLLNSAAGGKNGGGAVLTPEAVRLLENYDAYSSALKREADRLFSAHFSWIPEAAAAQAQPEK